jgi:hypothetical protein
MNALAFAWRSLVRQPARAALGVLGVAAVGALLLDMLLLSEGLIVSMRDLLDRYGWDVRVTGGDLPLQGPRIRNATETADAIVQLPSVRTALLLRLADAHIERSSGAPLAAQFVGVRAHSRGAEAPRPPWTIVRGHDVSSDGEIVVNNAAAQSAGIAVGGNVTMRASCTGATRSTSCSSRRLVILRERPLPSVRHARR